MFSCEFCKISKNTFSYRIHPATLCLQEEEMLVEKVKGFPVVYDKKVKGFKEKDAVQNAWEKVAESLEFAENGNFIRASSN